MSEHRRLSSGNIYWEALYRSYQRMHKNPVQAPQPKFAPSNRLYGLFVDKSEKKTSELLNFGKLDELASDDRSINQLASAQRNTLLTTKVQNMNNEGIISELSYPNIFPSIVESVRTNRLHNYKISEDKILHFSADRSEIEGLDEDYSLRQKFGSYNE